MKIEKHGNTYKSTTCELCDCEFSYTQKDIEMEIEMEKISYDKYVVCPECGREQWIYDI